MTQIKEGKDIRPWCKHVMLKGISQADVAKTPAVALLVAQLRHQSFGQSIRRKVFWAKLKALIIPNQYYQSTMMVLWGCYISGQKDQTFHNA